MHEGSPAEHADRIQAPVPLFHAAMDDNVVIQQFRIMDQRLRAAGGKCTLVTWEKLDHQLDDSAARARRTRSQTDPPWGGARAPSPCKRRASRVA